MSARDSRDLRCRRFAPWRALLAVLLLLCLGACSALLMPGDATLPRQNELLERGDREMRARRFGAAAAAFGEALALAERYQQEMSRQGYSPSPARVALTLEKLGLAQSEDQRFADAVASRRRALEIRERTNGPESLYAANLLNDLGYDLRRLGRHAEARASLERAASLFGNAGQKPREAMAINNLAHVDDAEGRLAEAERGFCRAFMLTEEAIGGTPQPAHAGYRQFQLHLRECAAAKRKAGKPGEAERLERRFSGT